ncbi:MAG: 50S ribosomal protein L30 [Methanomassiliicoccales archaeon]
MTYAAIRVRGHSKIKHTAELTLEQLHLHRVNHLVLLPETETSKRMLQVVKDYVTWGEIDRETLADVIAKAARLPGGVPAATSKDSLSVAQAILDGKATLEGEGIKRVIRLHPPRKGWEAIKLPYAGGGSLGYRGADINTLIKKMMPVRSVQDGKQNE